MVQVVQGSFYENLLVLFALSLFLAFLLSACSRCQKEDTGAVEDKMPPSVPTE